jgi:hypothetical protein
MYAILKAKSIRLYLWRHGRAGIEDHRAWFKNGLFWVTQTIRILPPGKGGFDTAMKKPGSVSNPFRVQLKGAETA